MEQAQVEQLPVETTIYSLSAEPPRPCERRSGERHLTLFRVGTMVVDGQRELCLIKNISAGGLMLRVYRALEPGRELTVELKCGQPLRGRVSWVRDLQIGLAFDEPVDVVALLSQTDDGPRPRMPRIETHSLVCVREGALTYRLRACDISQGGIKVEAPSKLRLGDAVVVSIAGLPPQPGVVRWSDEGCAGITFNQLLPLPQLIAWLQAKRESARAA